MTITDRDLLPEGLEDRLPPATAAEIRITRAIRDVMDSHGYDPVRPPLIEFEKSMAGRMAGIKPRRMFRFVDPGSLRTLALRSDITVQIGRMAATSMAQAPRPLRLSYSGQVATIRGDGLDPTRERHQIGAELIGADSAAAAAEIVCLAIEALEAAGATGISVDFTLPDLVDTLATTIMPLPQGQIEAVCHELDAKNVGGLKALGADAYLPLMQATGLFDQAIEQLVKIDTQATLAPRIAGLRQIAASIGGRARITLDPTERHGFEYQSWFGFTLYASGIKGALGRGGAYRILGADEPAIGVSLYTDALVSKAAESEKRDTLFLPLGHDDDAAARLRAIGWRTIAALGPNDDARALGCSHTLIGAEPKKF